MRKMFLGLLDVSDLFPQRAGCQSIQTIQANEVGARKHFKAHALSTLGRKPRRRVTLCLSLGLLDVSTQAIQAIQVGGLAYISRRMH